MSKFVFLVLTTTLIACSTTSATGQSKKKTNANKKILKQSKDINELSREIGIKLRAAKKSGNLLTEMQILRKLEKESRSQNPAALQIIHLFMMKLAAELGNYRDAHRYADSRLIPYPKLDETLKELNDHKPVNSLDSIAKLAHRSQLILINEAHHVPQHRAFSIRLLKLLRKQGFTHFAAETFYATDTSLNKRGYATKASGAYIKEPLYAELVRTALRLGYEVIPYEWNGIGKYTPDRREREQAKNLFERIFKKNPQAKVLVHAGYSHINESGTLAGAKTMSQRLTELTGIDPLTIDQTKMTEHSKTQYEHPLYTALMRDNKEENPYFLANHDGKLWSLTQGKVDLTLIHPRSVYKQGRPDWLSLGGDRKPHIIPADYLKDSNHFMVTARFAGESKEAIPVDRLEIKVKDTIPVLILPKGKFEIQISNAKGEVLKSYLVDQK